MTADQVDRTPVVVWSPPVDHSAHECRWDTCAGPAAAPPPVPRQVAPGRPDSVLPCLIAIAASVGIAAAGVVGFVAILRAWLG